MMGIESTITLTRHEAINRLEYRLEDLKTKLNDLTDNELEELLYGTRESIFDNFMITTHIS